MLAYCATHERGLIPVGYDLRQRRSIPATWHPLSRWTLARAWQLAQAGGCAGQIVLVAVACDQCVQPGRDVV